MYAQAKAKSVDARTATHLTLLDLIAAAADVAESDEEVVALVRLLIDSGRVRLVGQFCGEHIAASTH